jgi:hypothetical protein
MRLRRSVPLLVLVAGAVPATLALALLARGDDGPSALGLGAVAARSPRARSSAGRWRGGSRAR